MGGITNFPIWDFGRRLPCSQRHIRSFPPTPPPHEKNRGFLNSNLVGTADQFNNSRNCDDNNAHLLTELWEKKRHSVRLLQLKLFKRKLNFWLWNDFLRSNLGKAGISGPNKRLDWWVLRHLSVADPGFPRRGASTSKEGDTKTSTYYSAKFVQKLHENKKNGPRMVDGEGGRPCASKSTTPYVLCIPVVHIMIFLSRQFFLSNVDWYNWLMCTLVYEYGCIYKRL